MNGPSERVTMKEIAERAGVSTAAVSYVLRGRAGVSASTRERVRGIAEQMGYTPDPLTSALAESRWRKEGRSGKVSIAVLSAGASLKAILEPVRRMAERAGYVLHVVDLLELKSAKELNRRLTAFTARGVILLRTEAFHERAHRTLQSEDLAWDRFAWIAYDEGRFSPPCHRVLNNTFSNVRLALSKLRDRGFRRILYVRQMSELSRDNVRQEGAFLQFQHSHPEVEVWDLELVPGQPFSASELEQIEKLHPDVLLCGYTWIRPSLPPSLQALPFASMAIWSESADRSATAGIRLSREDLARASVDILDTLIRRSEFGVPVRRNTILVDGIWQDGASLNRGGGPGG